MARQRSDAYMAIRDERATDLASRDWKPWGPRWRARVGLTRMTAEAVAGRADTLLRDINLSTHRDDPHLQQLLEEARAATQAYYYELIRDNWDRLEWVGRHAVEETGRQIPSSKEAPRG